MDEWGDLITGNGLHSNDDSVVFANNENCMEEGSKEIFETNEESKQDEFYKKVNLCSTRICCATILNAQRRIKSLNRTINKETDDLRLRNKLRMKTMLLNRLERLKHKLRDYEKKL